MTTVRTFTPGLSLPRESFACWISSRHRKIFQMSPPARYWPYVSCVAPSRATIRLSRPEATSASASCFVWICWPFVLVTVATFLLPAYAIMSDSLGLTKGSPHIHRMAMTA